MPTGMPPGDQGPGRTGVSEAIGALRQAGALEESLTEIDGGGSVGILAGERGWQILVWAPPGIPAPKGIAGGSTELSGGTLITGDPNHGNANALRQLVPWLRPRLVGEATSAGVGDRLGIATPGHVAACHLLHGGAS